MKVIRNINNNVAVCIDSAGKELIAIGKGIGFKKPPYEIDVKDIERTYYNLDNRYISLLEVIEEDIIQLAIDIRNYTERKNIITSPNLVFTLADHIKFAIERVQKGISFQLPIETDIQKMFPIEVEIGLYALDLIERRLGQKMPEEEAVYIAIDILNSELETNKRWHTDGQLVNEVMSIVADKMNIQIDKKSFSYSRFVSHLYYLLGRSDDEPVLGNKMLLMSIIKTNPKEYNCALAIKEKIDKALSKSISNDEVLYLALHVARLCDRRDTK
jgi:beta-glucoside operon transcriptional antiterminator